MSEQQQPTNEQQQQPIFGVEKIYMKDMSLELPNAPQIFFDPQSAGPQIEVSLHNEATPLQQDGMFQVVLTATVTAKAQDKTVFLVEAAQAGIFQIRFVPQPTLDAVLATLCPATLLPYVREAISSLVQRAGFPPVTLQHMNFDAIYQQRLQELQAQQAQAAAAGSAAKH